MASRNRGYARGVLDAMVMVSQHGIAHSRRGHMHKARLAQLVFPSFKRPHGLHRRTFVSQKKPFFIFFAMRFVLKGGHMSDFRCACVRIRRKKRRRRERSTPKKAATGAICIGRRASVLPMCPDHLATTLAKYASLSPVASRLLPSFTALKLQWPWKQGLLPLPCQ